MTQDHGPGYVVRGEVVADDDTGEIPAEQAGPVTHFEKVASAQREDQPEPTAPDAAGNGSADAPADEAAPSDEIGSDEAGSDEVGAVRSPDAGGLGDGEDEGSTEPPGAGPVADGDQADGVTGPHEVTAPSAAVPAAAVPADPVAADPVAAAPGEHAGAPAEPELRPGEADGGLGDLRDLTYGSLLPDAPEFRERWQQVQFRFVDDPYGSVTEAADVIAQVTARLEAAIAERQRAVAERQRSLRGRRGEGTNADTETLRATLLMYRAFLGQLTGVRAG